MTAVIRFEDGNWIGSFNGRKVAKSYDQKRVIRMMKNAGHANVPIVQSDNMPVNGADNIVQDETFSWPINQRFEFVSQLVSMVANGIANSVIITGPGGLGKSHTVMSTLVSMGLKDASGFDVESTDRSFRVIKGYSTAKGLYRELFANRNSVIVFDDCDSVLKDPVALNLLKGALDSYDRRIISWNADIRDDDLPRSFQFDGRVIFISNMKREAMDQAMLTRAYCVDLAMSTAQKIERMAVLANSADFMPQVSKEHKLDALDLINELGSRVREISLRTLQAVARIRAMGGNWRPLAEYTLTN